MSHTITLSFANAITPAELREIVEGLGGGADPVAEDGACLSSESGHVWAYVIADDDDEEFDPEEDAEYERLLGGPIVAEVSMGITRAPDSPRLALEIIEAVAARGWRLVVDNGCGPMTLDTLRDRATRFSSVFWEAPWDWK